MPGYRLVLSKNDDAILNSFFAYPNFSQSSKNYLKLTDLWKSTNELRQKFDEPARRMKDRLIRLEAFGLLKTMGIQKGSRWDSYWYISDAGIYYIMSKQSLPHLKKFLQTNEDKRELAFIKELLQKKSGEAKISYLFHQIELYVNRKEYSRISQIVYEWLRETFGKHFVRFHMIPDFYSKRH